MNINEKEADVLKYLEEHKMSRLGPIAKALGLPRIQLIKLMCNLDREGKVEIGRAFNKCHNSIYFSLGEIQKLKSTILDCFKLRPKSIMAEVKAEIYQIYPRDISSFVNQLIASFIGTKELVFEISGTAKLYSVNTPTTEFQIALPRVRALPTKTYSGFPPYVTARLDSSRGYFSVPISPERLDSNA